MLLCVHDSFGTDLERHCSWSTCLCLWFLCSCGGARQQGVEKDMAQLADQADDHVNDPTGLTNKVEKSEDK